MIYIDDLISEMKSLYQVEGTIRFCHPAYEKFHQDLMDFIYENHFENTQEWETISQNLVYKSTQYMSRSEGDIILVQLDLLKRRVLAKENEGFWSYIHPLIYQVSEERFHGGFYADAVESALKEVNSRVKKLYRKYRNEEKDGQDLMRKAFTPSNPFLIFEGIDTESGRNVQEGYMQIFAGAMQGIRNPKAHENLSISREDAIKRLVLASLLMDKIDEAVRFASLSEL
ncbi:MAG: TIGR02391 family protein [Oscillibacter sp.]|nr:TIGR02391 family protein [Oscillibacter sp.]